MGLLKHLPPQIMQFWTSILCDTSHGWDSLTWALGFRGFKRELSVVFCCPFISNASQKKTMKNVIFIGDWKTYLEAFLLGYILGGWDSCLFLANATACLSRISLGCGGSSQLLLICNPWCSNIYLKNKTRKWPWAFHQWNSLRFRLERSCGSLSIEPPKKCGGEKAEHWRLPRIQPGGFWFYLVLTCFGCFLVVIFSSILHGIRSPCVLLFNVPRQRWKHQVVMFGMDCSGSMWCNMSLNMWLSQFHDPRDNLAHMTILEGAPLT